MTIRVVSSASMSSTRSGRWLQEICRLGQIQDLHKFDAESNIRYRMLLSLALVVVRLSVLN